LYKKISVFLILVCFSFPVFKLHAQNLEEVIVFGNILFEQNRYFEAINEFQRGYFFSDDDRKSLLCDKIADCFQAIHEMKSALLFLDSACFYSKNDSCKTMFELKKIHFHLLNGDYGIALLEIEDLESSPFLTLDEEKNFYKGIALFGLSRFEESVQTFSEIIDPEDSIRNAQFQQVKADLNKIHQPLPALAIIMSTVLPGLGQTYSGYFHSGLNSFVLLSSMILLGISNQFIDMAIIMPYSCNFYLGGILNAGRLARERRLEQQFTYFNKLAESFSEKRFPRIRLLPPVTQNNYKGMVLDSDSQVKILISTTFLFYKKFLSSQNIDVCNFYPSCSVYMMKAIQKKGVLLGILEGFDRLLRCHFMVGDNDYPFNFIINKYNDDI
jgi:putative component of membrane protein insertase Oxa1/YidC/SpoIIIJ protein YidD